VCIVGFFPYSDMHDKYVSNNCGTLFRLSVPKRVDNDRYEISYCHSGAAENSGLVEL